MTRADRLVKAIHMAIEREREAINAGAEPWAVRIVAKPAAESWRVGIIVEKAEVAV